LGVERGWDGRGLRGKGEGKGRGRALKKSSNHFPHIIYQKHKILVISLSFPSKNILPN